MPQKPLPSRPNLEHFRRQARDLQKACHAGDPEANQRIREFHPRLYQATDAQIAASKFALADAQLTIAREYGFAGWAKLKEAVEKQAFVDPATPFHERIEDATFRHVVDLIDAGNASDLREWLTEHPELVRRRVTFGVGHYFAHPTLLQFVAENPVRRDTLPGNIVEIAQILLDAGANADDGTLALVSSGRVARERGAQIPLIDLLCQNGADPNKAMLASLTHDEFDAADALVRNGAHVDLATAAALGRSGEVKNLLSSASELERHMALALAAQHGRSEVVRLLLDGGEDPSRYNPLGAHAHSTPLHQAVWYGYFETVRLLVERGARLDLRDTIYHGTPLDWAEHGGQTEIAAYLRERGG